MSELREKVLALPKNSGVYLMKNNNNDIIYVGKAKVLRNRVSQYFLKNAGHSIKTKFMISQIADFEIIITDTEFEALVLENTLIKKYQPRYNVLLKDDKGYPYIKVTTDRQFPEFSIVGAPEKDASRYFGPYSGRGAAKHTIDTISETLRIKTCRRKFPQDIGKERPCLNFHLKKCIAPCRGSVTSEQYRQLIDDGISLLQGKDKTLLTDLESRMFEASEEMKFEEAALLRDRIRAINRLYEKQNIALSGFSDTDALAFYAGKNTAVIVMLHYINGTLQGKDFTMFESSTADDADEILSGFIKQYYGSSPQIPKTILVNFEISDMEQIENYLSQIHDKKVYLSVPQKGLKYQMCQLALKNGIDEMERYEDRVRKNPVALELLAKILELEQIPQTFEAYDISNTAGTETVGVMVVFHGATPKKSLYRKFKIKSFTDGQDDYRAMEEVLERRIARYKDGDEKFNQLPDIFLIDGGLGHVKIARRVLDRHGIGNLTFGMVKDDKHRTRGLVTPDGREYGISTMPALFAFVGRIGEEVHRFAIDYHRNLRGKSVKKSVLDEIHGIGEKRRQLLFKHFKTITAIKTASFEQLCEVVPSDTAQSIIDYFKKSVDKV